MTLRPRLPQQARTALHLNTVAARAAAATSTRRLRRQPRDPAWSLALQGLVEMMAQSVPNGCDSAAVLRGAIDSATLLGQGRRVPFTPARVAGVPALWTGDDQSPRVILYLHGGGYVCGSPQTHLGLVQQIADSASARLLALDYRLAPEAPYPAALEDAWSAYLWLLQEGTPPGHIVIAGDSAGGGLTIALLLALRDAGAPLPAAGVCLSPWLDLAHTGRSLHMNAGRDYLNLPLLRQVAEMYAGATDLRHALVSPLYADLGGLPPLLLQVGTDELLLDDSRRFARRAIEAGVNVDLEMWESMVHVWHFFYMVEPKARQAIRRIGRFVRAQTDVPEIGEDNGPAY